jgi:hypothetical protein
MPALSPSLSKESYAFMVYMAHLLEMAPETHLRAVPGA